MEREVGAARFAAVTDPATIVVMGRFLVDPRSRGGMASSLIILKVAELCVERKIEIVLGDCEPHLLGYYRSLGFRPYGRLFSHATSLLVPLALLCGDVAHLEAIDSPVLALMPPGYCGPPTSQVLALLDDTAARHTSDATDELARWWQTVTSDSARAPELFDDLDPGQRHRLLDASFVLDFEPGDLLIGEGLATRTVYAILDGTVEILVGDQLVDVAQGGSVVGEFAMLMDTSRTATIRAATAGRAVTISDRHVDLLLDEAPELAARLMRNLCRILVHKFTAPHGA